MQVTIYLQDDLIKKLDTIAKKSGQSRSALIQEILVNNLHKSGKGTAPKKILTAFGRWKDVSKKNLGAIRRALGKDVKRTALT